MELPVKDRLEAAAILEKNHLEAAASSFHLTSRQTMDRPKTTVDQRMTLDREAVNHSGAGLDDTLSSVYVLRFVSPKQSGTERPVSKSPEQIGDLPVAQIENHLTRLAAGCWKYQTSAQPRRQSTGKHSLPDSQRKRGGEISYVKAHVKRLAVHVQNGDSDCSRSREEFQGVKQHVLGYLWLPA